MPYVPQSERNRTFFWDGVSLAGYNPCAPHSEDNNMERPGEKLKRVRERLTLTYRDVEQASRQIAARRGSDSFAIALSRLADIEHKGTIPTIHRIYTLCAIYRLDYEEVLRWYGVTLEMLESEAMRIGLRSTHAAQFTQNRQAIVQ